MSEAVQQFLQIVRETWRTILYCEYCCRETEHVGSSSGRQEIYTCKNCNSQKWYTVK